MRSLCLLSAVPAGWQPQKLQDRVLARTNSSCRSAFLLILRTAAYYSTPTGLVQMFHSSGDWRPQCRLT